jgi:UDP:flavonoid glycosyltransferase YjiC (YdhE family)
VEDGKMKLLIAVKAMPGESSGPISRARALAAEAMKRGHEVAFCAGEDQNYRPVEGVKNFFAPVPSIFGTPRWAGRIITYFGRVLGIQNRIAGRVRSYEQVLHLLGITTRRFFARDVESARQAIRSFQPDVVFSELRIAAIVAARLEQVPVVTDYAYAVQPSFASSPESSAGVREYLQRHGLPAVHSALELFDWAELKFVASSYELEPIAGANVIHVGPFQPAGPPPAAAEPRSHVLAYMGTGIIPPRRLLRVLSEACQGTAFQLYIGSRQLTPGDHGTLHVQHYFDFDALLPRAVASVHHGGQNSVMKGLIHGVPQIIVPGRHFERGYNADSVVRLQAGVRLDPAQFTPKQVRGWIDTFAVDPAYGKNALAAGQDLLKLGGAAAVVTALERRFTGARAAAS